MTTTTWPTSRRQSHRFTTLFLSLLLLLALLPAAARATDTFWNFNIDGVFDQSIQWTAGVPGTNDNAFFNLPGPYTVSFGSNPTNASLQFNNSTVFFDVVGGDAHTYTIFGPTTLNAANLTISTPPAVFALNTSTLDVNSGSTGLGQSGGVGNLTFQNSAQDSFASICATNTDVATTGSAILIQSGADVTASGTISMGISAVAPATLVPLAAGLSLLSSASEPAATISTINHQAGDCPFGRSRILY